MADILTPGAKPDKSGRRKPIVRAGLGLAAAALLAGCVTAMRAREEAPDVDEQQTASFALG